ncbi:MAG: hypothetical protein LBC63_04415 [Holophagales bacterium]|nr:hypothetical protein [Holophagales bacterium]
MLKQKPIVSLVLAFAVFLSAFGSVCAQANGNEAPLAPTELRVNLLREARNVSLAFDPVFSWVFRDNDDNEVQTAYRLQISRTANFDGALAYDPGWKNNGNAVVDGIKMPVSSIASVPKSNFVGNSLYYWRVNVKDKDGNESPWSESSPFVTAMAGNGYSETFSNGSGWTSLAPMWTGTGTPSWTDYTVEADLTPTQAMPTGTHALTLVFRYQNSAHWYGLQFRTDNTVSPLCQNGGSAFALGTTYDKPLGVALPPNKTIRVKIQVSGSGPVKIRSWIKDDPAASSDTYLEIGDGWQIAGPIIASGTIGLRTGANEAGWIDNVVVTNNALGHKGEVLYQKSGFTNSDLSSFTGATLNGGHLQASADKLIPYIQPSPRFMFFRRPFTLSQAQYNKIDRAVLAVAGRGTENDKLLSYFLDLYMNGKSLGVGPARDSNKGQFYNSFDVTDFLRQGDNLLAFQAYSANAKTALLQLTLFNKDGTKEILFNSGEDFANWRVKDGTLAFGNSNGETFGTVYFTQPKENMDGRYYPAGWNMLGFVEDASWEAAKLVGSLNLSAMRLLLPYPAENTLVFEMPAKSKAVITGSGGKCFQVIDLGKEIIGAMRLKINNPTSAPITVTVQTGESLITTALNGSHNAADAPYGTVRYTGYAGVTQEEKWTLAPGDNELSSFMMKCFRWIQFPDAGIEIEPAMVTGLAVRQDFDASDAVVDSDNDFLSRLMELSRYTIMATNQDVYVDSQYRERGAYEGDLIINAYASYGLSANYALARHSDEYLLGKPTWPPEYRLFSIEMAYADYLYTGDDTFLKANYNDLKNKLPGESGSKAGSAFNASYDLCRDPNSGDAQSGAIVDWPKPEQDGYIRSGASGDTSPLTDAVGSFTTVFNAVACGAYSDMAAIADVVGNASDAAAFREMAAKIKASLISKLYDSGDGGFFDSISPAGRTTHKAQHATFYALAYGIFDDHEMARKMVDYLKNDIAVRGLKPSVYGMYFLLRGLYNIGAGEIANGIMLQDDPSVVRSWAHMLDSLQATISTEAWNPGNKSNMTFSHPWGNAPGSEITRGLFGIQPIYPGFNLFQIKFQPGGKLHRGSISTASVKGTIKAAFKDLPQFIADVSIPANSRARVSIPAKKSSYGLASGLAVNLTVNGETAQGIYDNGFIAIELGSGRYTITQKAANATSR